METVKIIQAGEKLSWLNYARLVMQNRNLMVTLAKRDIQIKYAQSMLGIFWVLIQPVVGVVLFTLVISRWFKVSAVAYPYPLFAFTGILAWNFFSYVVTSGGTSLSDSRDLIHRISFPRIILPGSKILVGLFDLMIALLLLIVILPFAHIGFHAQIIFLPVFIFVLIIAGFSLAVWLSALTIRFRDFYHLIPYLIGFGIWLTPVFYSMEVVPEKFRFILYLNPVAFAVEGFRWCLFNAAFDAVKFAPSMLLVLCLLLSGLFYFRSVEKNISDTI